MKVPISISTAELLKELARREKQIKKVKAIRDRLAKRMEKLNHEISQLEGTRAVVKSAPKKEGEKGQWKKRKSLANLLHEVLKDKGPVSRTQAAQIALKSGYKSKSKGFIAIVGKTLREDNRFKKVRWGTWEVK